MEKILDYFLTGDRPMELAKLVGTALIAYFTLTLSLKKFFKEKRWEKKFEAYSKIIEALHHLKSSHGLYESLDQEAPDATQRFLHILKKNEDAKAELNKYIDVGSFYILPTAIDEINKLRDKYNDFPDEWNVNQVLANKNARIAIKDCLEAIKRIADQELHKTD